MGNKGSSGTITQTEVRNILATAAEHLSAREEKAVRMRTGSGVAVDTPLPRRGRKTEARAELTALEIDLRRKLKEREARLAPEAPRTETKEKIIRALRRLK
jgi:hypothetical protein